MRVEANPTNMSSDAALDAKAGAPADFDAALDGASASAAAPKNAGKILEAILKLGVRLINGGNDAVNVNSFEQVRGRTLTDAANKLDQAPPGSAVLIATEINFSDGSARSMSASDAMPTSNFMNISPDDLPQFSDDGFRIRYELVTNYPNPATSAPINLPQQDIAAARIEASDLLSR